MIVRPKFRQATDKDSLRVQELFKLNDLWIDGLDWTELQGWFVAEHKEQVVGAVQVLLGKPLGVILYVMVDPTYHNAGIGPQLIRVAEGVLRINNSDGWMGVTNRDNMLKMAKRFGCTELYDVKLLGKRIARKRI